MLDGQQAVARRLYEADFNFRLPDAEVALRDFLSLRTLELASQAPTTTINM